MILNLIINDAFFFYISVHLVELYSDHVCSEITEEHVVETCVVVHAFVLDVVVDFVSYCVVIILEDQLFALENARTVH